MANAEQLALLKGARQGWYTWRIENPNEKIDLAEAYLGGAYLGGADLSEANLSAADLSEANLSGAWLIRADLIRADLSRANLVRADLSRADLREAGLIEANLGGANLIGANLYRANLDRADLSGANLSEANLSAAYLSAANLNRANLSGANLSGANLSGAYLSGAYLSKANLSAADLSRTNLSAADLSGADLSGANLTYSNLLGANISNAKMSKGNVHGVNVWDLEGEFKEQKDLVITPPDTSPITVDNIKVAQFIYLILNNKEIRDVINTLTSKSVLILGRFAEAERKTILDALRNKLREYNLLPIVFDFDRPIDRNITETVKTLAAISYFVIADVTSPKSSPLELQAIIPDFQIPVVPIIQEEEFPFSMIADLQSQHHGVLDPLTYHSEETLIKALKAAVIDPAIKRHQELRLIKAQKRSIRKAEDFIEDKGLE